MDALELKRLKEMFNIMLEKVSSFNPSRYCAEKSPAVPSSRHGSRRRSMTLAIGVYAVFGSNHPTLNWWPHPESPLDFDHIEDKDAGPLLTFLSGWMDVLPNIYEAAGDYELFSHISAISIHHKLQIQGMHHRTKIKDSVIFN